MSLSPQWLDELRSRVTLSGVVMRTTKLQRAGREWKACCPFHNEKTPSFTVNDEKGFYHCFGCGAHGDVIRWMTDQRGLQFMDAVKELAAEAGMEVPALDPRQLHQAEQQAGLHEVMAAAQEWFRASLDTPEGTRARDYLKSRRFDAHTMERFGFGFAPDSRNALKAALEQFEEPMLIEAGLRIAVEEREPYDRFRGRLTIPIHDARGRVIGFAARILDAEKKDAPKYLNSPDTPLFDKGRTLFNLHRAGPASRKSGRVVVVEGQMDAIALAAAGIEEAVAPMGTAMTERQIEMLWRLVDKPILCFDGDSAGKRAAMRAAVRALPMLRPGHSLQFVTLPAGMDPDDLLRSKGREALEALLAAPVSLLDTLWQHERDAGPLASPEDKAGLKARLTDLLETIQHPDIKSLYRRDLMDLFSAFAFPRKDFVKRDRLRGQGANRWDRAAGARLAPGTAERLQKTEGSRLETQLAEAVFVGLERHPGQIGRHAERLFELAASVRAYTGRVEHLIEISEELESKGRAAISTPRLAPALAKAGISFLLDEVDPSVAAADLAEAVTLLVERPQVAAALVKANERYEISMSEHDRLEQERLRQKSDELTKRLTRFWRSMAAA